MGAQRLLRKGCQGFLAVVQDTEKEVIDLNKIPMVKKFSDVFPNELPRIPPDREIEFGIEVISGTQPISIPPYCMTSTKLKELKN